MLQVGTIKIHLINDGTILADGGGPFGLVPRALWSSKFMPPVRDNLLPMTHTCLLIQTDGKNIVVDTGHGSKDVARLERIFHLSRPEGDLLAGLNRLDIEPEDIDLVIDTHLHADHSGGNTYLDAEGNIQSTFPNAEYVVQRREYEDAIRPNERTRATYIAENFVPLVESGQMRLLDGDTDLLPGIRGVVTPGHTPGHMSVVIEDNGEHAVFVCDMASFAIHFERLGWMTSYDVEPLITLETKRKWQEWALQNNAMLIFPHDPECHVARLVKENGKPKLVKINETFV